MLLFALDCLGLLVIVLAGNAFELSDYRRGGLLFLGRLGCRTVLDLVAILQLHLRPLRLKRLLVPRSRQRINAVCTRLDRLVVSALTARSAAVQLAYFLQVLIVLADLYIDYLTL